jgi:hypothetical protein
VPRLIAAEGNGLDGGHSDLGNLHAFRVALQQKISIEQAFMDEIYY